MADAFDQVRGLLPKLNPEQLHQVIQQAKVLRTITGHEPPEELTGDWLLSGLATFLQKRGVLVGRGPEWQLQQRKGFKTYQIKRHDVIAYLERIEQQLTTVSRHRVRLGLLCASALADLLDDWGIFGVNQMLTQIDKVPEALDRSYPGYIRSGLFRFVLQQVKEE